MRARRVFFKQSEANKYIRSLRKNPYAIEQTIIAGPKYKYEVIVNKKLTRQEGITRDKAYRKESNAFLRDLTKTETLKKGEKLRY